MIKIEKGMIIRFKEDLNNQYARNWIILPVSKKDIKRGMNAEKEGLYGFGGLWYGRNPMKSKNYGKISSIMKDFIIIKKRYSIYESR